MRTIRFGGWLFYFPELEGLCNGYSADVTRGSGMGPGLRTRILRTATEIVDAGVEDTEILKLVGLFETDIGPNRISEDALDLFRRKQDVRSCREVIRLWCARSLKEWLHEITERVSQRLAPM